MPDLGPEAYLVDYWMRLGCVGQSSGGMVPLSWQDIQSWSSLMGIEFTPWESETLATMSVAYLIQLQESEDRMCPPPAGKGHEKIDRALVAKQVELAFSGLIGKDKKGNRGGL